jgi:hypothetical protein
MLKLKLFDREVMKAMKGDEELYDLVKQTENLLNKILNMSDVCITNISDNDVKVINDSINILKSKLVMTANERRAIYTILENQKTIMGKIEGVDGKIDYLLCVNKQ